MLSKKVTLVSLAVIALIAIAACILATGFSRTCGVKPLWLLPALAFASAIATMANIVLSYFSLSETFVARLAWIGMLITCTVTIAVVFFFMERCNMRFPGSSHGTNGIEIRLILPALHSNKAFS